MKNCYWFILKREITFDCNNCSKWFLSIMDEVELFSMIVHTKILNATTGLLYILLVKSNGRVTGYTFVCK